MKKDIQLSQTSSLWWSSFLESNPQLFREIKGRVKAKNIVVAAAIAFIAQFIAVATLLAKLPDFTTVTSAQDLRGRYGLGGGYSRRAWTYTQDLLGNWLINWQLLWLDLFIILSIVGVAALLVIGTYMLIADTVKEESRGTLNFIRLTPQSAGKILLGKVLGVPILLYISVLLLLPLHIIAGISAGISPTLIAGFYGVVVASCTFFYSAALLWSMTNLHLSGFKPWLISGAMGLLFFVTTVILFENNRLPENNLWDLLLLANPIITLSYLIDSTFLPQNKIDFLAVSDLGNLLFYGQALWTKASIGIGFLICNFSLWAYWCWNVLKRRFRNPERTLISKTQSYWLTGWFVAISLGFTLQTTRYSDLADNFVILQSCLCFLALGLIAALSPHRQALNDWARYRHQTNRDGNLNLLWKELIFGENSPSTGAIAINLAIVIIYLTPSIFLMLDREIFQVFSGLILSAGSILLYAIIAQLILTSKTRKRSVWAVFTISSMIILPMIYFGFADMSPTGVPHAWLFSFIPGVVVKSVGFSAIAWTLIGQCLASTVFGLMMTRKLKQAGTSETKALLSRSTS